jgi:type IV pilus assembly protein PilM
MAQSVTHQHKRDEIVAIDLGSRVTKAVHLRRKGVHFQLQKYVLLDSPIYEKTPTVELLTDHLTAVMQAVGASTRKVSVALGGGVSLLCHADLPAASVSDLRKMVRLSPKTYVQQDLADYLFDCYGGEDLKPDGGGRPKRKAKVLVGGARKRLVENLQDGARNAGFSLEQVTLAQVATVNAFKMLAEESHGEVVALLDVGFQSSSINIVRRGELVLTRLVNIGADKFASALAQLSSWGEDAVDLSAAGSMTDSAQAKLQGLIMRLAKEVDASIGFFVNSFEVSVNQVYVSGGSARSEFIVQTLEAELGLPCESWNPAKSLELALPAKQKHDVEYDAAQMTVAVGAALGWLNPELISINLLAEEQEAVELRRRDPVRRSYWIGSAAVAAVLLWSAWLGFKVWQANARLKNFESELPKLQQYAKDSIAITGRAGEIERTLRGLSRFAEARSLWAPTLSALQFTAVPEIQFHRLRIEQSITPASPSGSTRGTNQPMKAIERTLMTIQAKNYGDSQSIDRLIETIAAYPFLAEKFRSDQPVLLKDVQPRQLDSSDTGRTFVFFTIECFFAERIIKDE